MGELIQLAEIWLTSEVENVQTLLSDGLWQILSRLAQKHRRIRAAISYVTAPHLNLRGGDLLICDASDEAISGGLTSARILSRFANQGAEILSYKGLHAKVAVIDDKGIIGSANLSENAAINTCEASLLTDDRQIVALIQSFVERLTKLSEPVTAKYLQRISAIPVIRTSAIRRTSHTKVEIGRCRLWLISTVPMSEKESLAEEAFEKVGRKVAQKLIRNDDYELRPIRWSGRSRFRSQAKPGDLVIEMLVEKRGKRRFTEVQEPAPILHRQDENAWTRFYLEVSKNAGYYNWRDFLVDLKTLGVTNITPRSTRELTGRAMALLNLLE